MVNKWDRIFVERSGTLHQLDRGFEDLDSLNRFAASVAVAVGRELNRKHPCLDTRLPGGFRLSIIVPPVALEGPIITIRKHKHQPLNHRELVQRGTCNEKLVVFLYQLVRCRQNLIISGSTNSGKTTLLNVLSSFIPAEERIITMEDTVELMLQVQNLVQMETKPPMGQDPGVSMRDLLSSALRMRPDRIIIGECRGGEAWDMLLAMNTGHDGSMTTLHCNSAFDALRRLESMILRAGVEVPLNMIKNDISSTVNYVIHMERNSDGKRRVVEVIEVTGRKGETYSVDPVFTWDEKEGFKSTGHVPQFVTYPNHPEMQLTIEFFKPEFKYKAAI